MLNYNNAEIALQFMVDTDDDFARAKTLYDALCEQKKSIAALEYGKLTGSAAEKNQQALASEVYQLHLRSIRDAQIEFEILRSKRLTNMCIIDMWRSVNSNQRKGNI